MKRADESKMTPNLEKLENLLKTRGILRVGELASLGFSKSYLSELGKRGRARRQARGIYVHPDADIPAHYSLAVACNKVSHGVICLLSALRHHEIGTQSPSEVWMAIDRKARYPTLNYPRLRIVRFSGEMLAAGVETVEGAFPLRVYCPAKTIADCFRYRHKIGIDVAVEALKAGWRERRFTVKEINHYARICRVGKVITPYMEAIL
ncbi:type IV toxin-antitoxin system AbiEi family antitoxin domain-containing protein [Termitidicoccus mucosus]